MSKCVTPLVAVALLAGCANTPSWLGGQPTPPPVTEPAPYAAPAAGPVHHTMVPGTSGLRAMQWKLADLGYYHGKLDGKKGPQTHAALARFQQNMGVQPVTGEPDDQTWSALGLSEGN